MSSALAQLLDAGISNVDLELTETRFARRQASQSKKRLRSYHAVPVENALKSFRGQIIPEIAILPAQFFTPQSRQTRVGEVALHVAIIEDAILVLQRESITSAAFSETYSWLHGAHATVTFETACCVAGYEQDRTRNGILRLIKGKHPRRKPQEVGEPLPCVAAGEGNML